MAAKTETVKTVKFNAIKSDKLDAAIAGVAKRGQTLQADMHRVAASVLLHVGSTGDIRPIYKLLAAMPEMARTNGLRNWFEQFGPVKITAREDGTDHVQFVKDKPTKLGDALAKPFWKFSAKEGQPYEPIDVLKMAEQAIKRLEKDAKETGRDHSALINALKTANAAPAAN